MKNTTTTQPITLRTPRASRGVGPAISFHRGFALCAACVCLTLGVGLAAQAANDSAAKHPGGRPTGAQHSGDGLTSHTGPDPRELPLHVIPNISGGEYYFSPDSKRLIGGGPVFTVNIDGADKKVIKHPEGGEDACSFIFPDGKRAVWTSTFDHPELPKGDWSNQSDYPRGAELYVSDLDGNNRVRLTNNTWYDAECSVSPDGKWIVFGRNTNNKMDLWRVNADGTGEKQLTHLEGLEPGGAQFLPNGERIIFRAWPSSEVNTKGKHMEIYTIKSDGTDLRQHTHNGELNWAPVPASDNRHYVFVKLVPPGRNFEVFLGDLEKDEPLRLTYNNGFDAFPAISPDGKWVTFSSSRDSKPGQRRSRQYLLDISSLNIGPKN